MINPKKELFIWGPIDGRPIYTSYFMMAIKDYLPRIYKYKLPEILFFFIKNKMTFIADYFNLRKSGKKHFNTWLMNDKNLKKLKTDFKKAVNDLNNLQEKISNKFLSSLKDKEFFEIYNRWQQLYLSFWGSGLVPETANWGGEQILKEILQKKIKDEKQFIKALEKLSAPEKLSFYQQEELDLLNIKNSKKFNELIKRHAEKYFWIRNNYFEQKQLTPNYFKELLSKLKQPNYKINEIKNFPKKALLEKKLIIKKHKLDKKTVKISRRLSYSIWWQDARKKEIFRSNHYIDLFLKEIAKRKKIQFLDLKFYWPPEIIRLLKYNKKVPAIEISRRRRFVLFHYSKNTLTYRTGKREEDKVKPFLEKKVSKSSKIKGLVVSSGCGKVNGKARILLTPRNVKKMNFGEILVAPMTSPDYVIAMKKAAAIVTDEGGITSHAAIVSRELKIPCVIGTKIATKVLKDGDLVEVDAEKGMVKIIKEVNKK